MIVSSTFKADLFQLKHTKDPDALLAAIKESYAAALGRKIIESFPYVKVSGYEGELPALSMNKDHEFVDVWESRIVMLTEEQATMLMNVLRRSGMNELEIQKMF